MSTLDWDIHEYVLSIYDLYHPHHPLHHLVLPEIEEYFDAEEEAHQ